MHQMFRVIPELALPMSALAQAEPAGEVDHVALLQGLPTEAHAVIAAAFLTGLVLWALGARVVKPIFALIGLLGGAIVGLVVAGLLGLGTIAGVGGWIVAMAIGGIIGLVATLMLLKLAIIFTAAGAFAVVGAAAGLMYIQFTGGPTPPPERAEAPIAEVESPEDDGALSARDRIGHMLFRDPRSGELVTLAELFGDREDREMAEQIEHARVIAARVHAVMRSAADFVARQWAGLSIDQRGAIVGSTLGGLALGLAAGFFLPKRSTAVITALAGSATFLASGVWLIEALPALEPARAYVTQPPATWAVIWAIAAGAGLAMQLSVLGKKKDKSKKD